MEPILNLIEKYKDNPYGLGADSVEVLPSSNLDQMVILRFRERYSREESVKGLKDLGIKSKQLARRTADRAFLYRYELYIYP